MKCEILFVAVPDGHFFGHVNVSGPMRVSCQCQTHRFVFDSVNPQFQEINGPPTACPLGRIEELEERVRALEAQ